MPPFLKQQIGPFPLWGWLAMGVAGVGIGLVWRTMDKGGAAPTKEDDAAPPVIATEPVGYVFQPSDEDGQTRQYRPPVPPVAPEFPHSPTPVPPNDKGPQKPAPATCPKGQHYDAVQKKCVPDAVKAPTTPVPTPSHPTTPTPTAPQPTAPKVEYPGLPAGFVMDCQTANTAHNLSSFDGIDVAGYGTTLAARKSANWALANTGSPTGGGYYIFWQNISDPGTRGVINKDRVKWGLYPLTSAEFDQMQAQMKEMMPKGFKGERDGIFQSRKYARALFDKWNTPYQCGRSQAHSGTTTVAPGIDVRR